MRCYSGAWPGNTNGASIMHTLKLAALAALILAALILAASFMPQTAGIP